MEHKGPFCRNFLIKWSIVGVVIVHRDDMRKRTQTLLDLETIAKRDFFEVAQHPDSFVGNPFKIDYDSTSILTCDDWNTKVGASRRAASPGLPMRMILA